MGDHIQSAGQILSSNWIVAAIVNFGGLVALVAGTWKAGKFIVRFVKTSWQNNVKTALYRRKAARVRAAKRAATDIYYFIGRLVMYGSRISLFVITIIINIFVMASTLIYPPLGKTFSGTEDLIPIVSVFLMVVVVIYGVAAMALSVVASGFVSIVLRIRDKTVTRRLQRTQKLLS